MGLQFGPFAVGSFADSQSRQASWKGVAQQLTSLSPEAIDAVFQEVQTIYPERLALMKGLAARDPLTKIMPALQMFGMYSGVKERQSYATISFDVLRRMARKCTPVTAIIQTRCNQVSTFAKLPQDKTDSGFKIKMRETKARPTRQDEKVIEAMQRAIVRCGIVEPDRDQNEHTLSHFLKLLVRDSLTMDAMVFEVRPGRNREKYPAARWQAVDAALIRKVEPSIYRDKNLGAGITDKPTTYVQWVHGKVEAEYTSDELAYGIRNPVTDITAMGYGVSELEMLIDIVTAQLFAHDYNKSYFTQNSVPAGILSLVGNVEQEHLEAFRAQWAAQLQGPGNYWKTPIVAMPDGNVTYTPFRQAGANDMSYHLWLNYLISMACAVYAIHPEEVGFPAWSPMKSQLGSEASPVSRLKHSEDKGLVPLFESLAATINENVVWRINEDFEFVWQNLSEFDQMADIQYRTTRASMFTSIDQEREEMDLEPFGEWWSEIPHSPLVFSAIQQDKQMQAQQEQMQAMQGQGGPEPPQGDQDIQQDMEGQGNGQEFMPGPDGQVAQPGQPNAKAVMMARANQGSTGGATSTGKQNPTTQQPQMQMKKSLAEQPVVSLTSPDVAQRLVGAGIVKVGDMDGMSCHELGGLLTGRELTSIIETVVGPHARPKPHARLTLGGND